jgi:hypothetical protein
MVASEVIPNVVEQVVGLSVTNVGTLESVMGVGMIP